jgi:hypothetical protein
MTGDVAQRLHTKHLDMAEDDVEWRPEIVRERSEIHDATLSSWRRSAMTLPRLRGGPYWHN